ncbi:hypothetical protein B0H19DRAFT_1168673 [Mycena capillaripes]|nr:hypothetical protein B0H19DRAFT_1168673 [Mycena capillaripes]
MSSPSAVQRPYPPMQLDRILNHSSPPLPSTFQPPNVQPQNTRYVPPLPQMNEAYANTALEQRQYGLTAVGDDRPMSYSSAGPSQISLAPVNTYPPNRNSQLISANYSNESNRYKSPQVSPPPVSPYSERADLGLSSNYASHAPQQPSPHRQHSVSPKIDLSALQRTSRASERIIEGLSRQDNSPHHDNSQTSEQRKRAVSNVDDAEEPPKSKRKLNSKDPKGTNKRSGYTTRKRSEAAQIAAQNDRMPDIMWTVALGNDRDDARCRVVPVKFSTTANLAREAQTSRCMSSRYKKQDFPKCVACTRRWAGDTCRFQNIRSFFIDQDGNTRGFCFTEKQDVQAPTMKYPDKWNVLLELSHIHETKKTIAAALLPTLREELEHVSLSTVVYRPRESEVRATCDTCLTSIFSCSWMCRTCGREACPECFQQIQTLTIEPVGASQSKIDELQRRRDKHSHANPFFLACLKRNEHGAKDFSPMTRFSEPDLAQAIRDMEKILLDEGISVDEPSAPAASGSISTDSDHPSTSTSSSSGTYTPPNVVTSPSNDSEATLISNGDVTYPYAQLTSPVASGSNPEIPSHQILRFTDTELTDEIFRALWAKGDPLLVTDVGKKLKINWSPEYFMKEYGTESCLIIECQTEVSKRITVGEFFRDFGRYEGRVQCWKLKDWPPSSDFKTAFPELYEDFSQAVPIPNYVRRDGAQNIASHFPTNTVGPDLGPKMYNANANREAFGSKGSTRLHMDMADALNIMTYAAPDADGQEGCAAWDLFRAQDSDKIRQFMRSKFAIIGHDPIHMQQQYLDDQARRQLWEEYGVKSYRVYQKAGEAVFIPAGCAHQVRNLSDCIKVAIDFVSPENIERCEKLTREFREVNQTKVWKEDVLQLRTMMWFAWLSCCQQERLAGS